MRKDIRDMRRSDWHRIQKRTYLAETCRFHDMEGVVSLLRIDEVEQPLLVSSGTEKVLIADHGYSWLQVAFQGQYFWATVMYDDTGSFLQGYFDITGGNCFEDMENPTFADMYLDLVLQKDGKIQILDEEELDEAWEQKQISQKQYEDARAECRRLYSFLQEHQKEFLQFCEDRRKKLLKQMSER